MQTCTQCGKEPITNKKYSLGPRCMKLRKDPDWEEKERAKRTEQQQKSRERSLAKQQSKPKVVVAIKPRTNVRISQLSKKEQYNKTLLHQVYRDMDSETEQTCSGCGSAYYPLSHSHIISRHHGKQFESDRRNIVYDCLSIGDHKGCHDVWEHGTPKEKMQLLDYNERMQYIKEVYPSFHARLKTKEEEVTSPTKQ